MNMKMMTLAVGVCAGASFGQTFNFGLYTGQWENQTFGSTGAASVLIVDNGAGQVGLTINLDGNVFGIGDPPPMDLSGTLAGDVFTMTPVVGDPLFGDISGGIDAAGAASFDLVDAAGGGFNLVTLRGTAIGNTVHFDYEIFDAFAGGALFAVGIIDVAMVPSPSGAALIGLGGLVATRRRRR